jgi:lipopolysaccharide/colanic/teichoic acid biosynthesis glycosyltransferase
MQRALDIFLSSLALLVLSPLLVPIAIGLLLTGEHEVFYFQERIGKGGKTFKLFKFATMLKNSPNIGTGTITLKNDPRILPMGKFLRKTKINELPQLLNILFGDMSVIGPRPQTKRCFDAFPETARRAIVRVRPGLSGVGSIVFRDEEELMHGHADPAHFYDSVIADYKGRLEEWYVEHQGLRTYVLLILLTVWVILRPDSNMVWRAFPDLPPEPAAIAAVRAASRGR